MGVEIRGKEAQKLTQQFLKKSHAAIKFKDLTSLDGRFWKICDSVDG